MSNKPEPSQRIAFVWENFGPMHADRVDAVARAFPDHAVHGVQFYEKSETYSWEGEGRESFQTHTLFQAEERRSAFRRLRGLMRARARIGRATWFLCHYELPEVLLFAFWLRLTGARVYTMGCSKFDDVPRRAFREALKTLFYLPYHGAIGSQTRSIDYYRFLGFREARLAAPYNTLSVERMRAQAGVTSVHEADIPYDDRRWIVVARLVEKKNLPMVLDAYAAYRTAGGRRGLDILGDGPLEAELKQQADALGLSDLEFLGFRQTAEISRRLSRAQALILPSTEEQFGNVVIEAQALGLPVLVSDACGARESLVRNWQNGFVFEPDNPRGLARFMALLDTDEPLWRELADGASKMAPAGDVSAFAAAVAALMK
ncbi:glycosyltransferase family 4 protein [Vannielia litorea]|uniref:glycosyltransferase family 4 protein n=1 Tax=Vannielia litorea TaxID=1217970 RepID=UPI001BD0AA68|nr:glycosyltransferase family 4 protein [Vannielia litorea]